MVGHALDVAEKVPHRQECLCYSARKLLNLRVAQAFLPVFPDSAETFSATSLACHTSPEKIFAFPIHQLQPSVQPTANRPTYTVRVERNTCDESGRNGRERVAQSEKWCTTNPASVSQPLPMEPLTGMTPPHTKLAVCATHLVETTRILRCARNLSITSSYALPNSPGQNGSTQPSLGNSRTGLSTASCTRLVINGCSSPAA